MSTAERVAYMFDCDNTLFDNDALKRDLDQHLVDTLGSTIRDRYWEHYELVRDRVGYADYLGAIQELRLSSGQLSGILGLSTFLVDYPFSNRLFPGALKVLARLKTLGEVLVVTDGDAVFQPIKLRQSGIHDAVDGNVELFIHKTDRLEDIRERHPARHHVMVEDKPGILAEFKQEWGTRVTTVFVRQGHYADEHTGTDRPPGVDLMIDRIADLLEINPESLATPGADAASSGRHS